MKTLIVIMMTLLSFTWSINGQDKPMCNHLLFNAMVKSSLDFTVPIIDVDTLKKKRQEYIILDARSKEEYAVSHIKDALYIGFDTLQTDVLDKVDKDKPIAVYCSIGYRSEKIAEQLNDRGFTNVVNVYGSIFEWVNRGYPVVDPSGNSTNTVHGYNRMWGMWINNRDIDVVYKVK